jgi:hypothetical protein
VLCCCVIIVAMVDSFSFSSLRGVFLVKALGAAIGRVSSVVEPSETDGDGDGFGGAGGGGYYSGGGGAGGFKTATGYTITPGSPITVTVAGASGTW